MAFRYKVEVDKKFIWSEWNGTFSTDEVIEQTGKMFSDPQYQRAFRGLSDVRQANWQFEENGILRIHAFVSNSPQHPTGPWAVLCTEPLQTA